METKEIKLRLLDLEIKARNKAINLCDDIIKVVSKFNKKEPTKRLDTALKKIDKNLNFRLRHNSFIIDLNIENRSITIEEYNTHYIRGYNISIIHSSIRSGYGDGICQNGTINGELLMDEIDNSKQQMIQEVNKLKHGIENINNIITEKAMIDSQIANFKNVTPYLIREYFDLNF